MKVLILGGTRFIGRRVASQLVREGASVTVVSRSPHGAPPGAGVVASHRREFLQEEQIVGRFSDADYVIDMTAYVPGDVQFATKTFPKSVYVLASTTWIPQRLGESSSSQPISLTPRWAGDLPDVSRSYLSGKLACERELFEERSAGSQAYILRLPIVLGVGDHTGRSSFYLSRALDGRGQILVDGGMNAVQVISDRDVALGLVRCLSQGALGDIPILEALPIDSISVSEIAQIAARVAGVRFSPVSGSYSEIGEAVPGYLDVEPLWRERPLAVSQENLFSVAGHTPYSAAAFQESLMNKLLTRNSCFGERLPDEIGYLSGRIA